MAAERLISCRMSVKLQNVPVEYFNHGMECFWNIGEMLYGMNEDGR